MLNFFTLLFLSSSLFASPSSPAPKFQLCRPEIEKLINEWKGNDRLPWTRQLSSHQKNQVEIWRSPTELVGQWIEVQQDNDGQQKLLRLREKSTLVATFHSTSCVPKVELKLSAKPLFSSPKTTQSIFNDQDLTQLIKDNKSGLIYLWSPHMSISKARIPDIQSVAKELKLPLTILLDPQAGPQAQTQAKKSLGDNSLYTLNHSFELLLRQGLDHYPTLYVYKDGKIKNWRHPGAEHTKIYTQLIKKELDL